LLVCLAGTAFGQSGNLQEALQALPPSGGTLQLRAQRYLLRTPLNLRERRHVRLVGAGPATELVFQLDPEHAGAPLIDLTGSQRCELSHMTITSTGPKSRRRPDTGAHATGWRVGRLAPLREPGHLGRMHARQRGGLRQ
jgi:hypothetical protein